MEDGAAEKKEIGLIEAADNALKNRIVQKDQMQKFIEKKREMFLMQMTIDQKKEQIKQLEDKIYIRKMGLEKAELNIKEDINRFNEHLKRNKEKSNALTKDAGKVAEIKNQAGKRLKAKKDFKANEISQNTKKLETLQEHFEYKKFLDRLAPAEWQSRNEQEM